LQNILTPAGVGVSFDSLFRLETGHEKDLPEAGADKAAEIVHGCCLPRVEMRLAGG
jgi:hypothetical protein